MNINYLFIKLLIFYTLNKSMHLWETVGYFHKCLGITCIYIYVAFFLIIEYKIIKIYFNSIEKTFLISDVILLKHPLE